MCTRTRTPRHLESLANAKQLLCLPTISGGYVCTANNLGMKEDLFQASRAVEAEFGEQTSISQSK
jgi:hypothetical protein